MDCDPCPNVIVGEDGKKMPLSAVASSLARQALLEDEAKKKRFYRLGYLLFDVPIAGLGILLLIAGIALAIGLFFGLLQQEQQDLLQATQDESIIYQDKFTSYIESAAVSSKNLATLAGLKGINTTWLEFQMFFDNAGSGDKPTIAAIYPYVTHDNINSISSFINSQYESPAAKNASVPLTQPWTIYETIASTGAKFFNDSRDFWFPMQYVAPQNEYTIGGIGYNTGQYQNRWVAMQHAWTTGMEAATPRIISVFENSTSGYYSTCFYARIQDFNTGEKVGLIGAWFRIMVLVSKIAPVADISVFDISEGAGLNEAQFMYSTNQQWYNGTIDHQGHNIQLEQQLYANLTAMEQQGTIPSHFNVTVGMFRQWKVFVTPTDLLFRLKAINIAPKWVALALSLFFGCLAFAVCIAILVVKRMILSMTVTGLMSHKIQELQKKGDRMDMLIEKLAQEEQRIRQVVNLVPLSILIINSEGRVVYANEQFTQGYSFSQAEVASRTIRLQDVLPQIDTNALLGPQKSIGGSSLLKTDRTVIRTVARNKLGVDRVSRMCISFHGSNEMRSGGKNARARQLAAYYRTHAARNLSHSALAIENCFIIILFDGQQGIDVTVSSSSQHHRSQAGGGESSTAADSTDNSSSTTTTTTNSSKLLDTKTETKAFYKMLYDKQDSSAVKMMELFREFAKAEHSSESLLFFDAVEKYRRTERFMARVEMQQQILEDYLEQKSPHRLNLPNEQQLLQHRLGGVRECLGQPDIFDEILELVLLDLKSDLFSRFFRQQCIRSSMHPSSSSAVSTPISGGGVNLLAATTVTSVELEDTII